MGEKQKNIYVYADWEGLGGAQLMGILNASFIRNKGTFSFEYSDEWLNHNVILF